MPHRRYLSALALAGAVPLVLAACGGGPAGSSTDETLSILDSYTNEPDNSLLQDSLEYCAAELGVEFERETIPGKDRVNKVLQRASSRTLPDVLMLDNPEVQTIAETGALSPLSNYDIDTSGFVPGIIDAATHEGELYGLAPGVNTLGLFYNVDLLESAGIEPPQTWDELKTAAAALTEGDRYGIAFSAIASYEGAWQFLPFMWTNGGDETNLDTPENQEALQLLVDLVQTGSASNSVVNWSQVDVKDQFVAGKAAMMVNGPWQIPNLNDSDVTWGSVQIPVNEMSQTSVAPLGGEVWTVPVTGNEAKQATAAKFVECMAGDEVQLTLNTERYLVPTRTSLIEEYLEIRPDMAAFADQTAAARARTGQLGADWPEAATIIYNAVQAALTGQSSAEDAFATASNG